MEGELTTPPVDEAPASDAAPWSDELICEPCDPPEAAEEETVEEEEKDFFEEPLICGLWGCVLSRTHGGGAAAVKRSSESRSLRRWPGQELNKQIQRAGR